MTKRTTSGVTALIASVRPFADCCRNQASCSLDLFLPRALEENEEVRVERDGVPPSEIAIRPERIEPALRSAARLVLLERAWSLCAGLPRRTNEVTASSVVAKFLVTQDLEGRTPVDEPITALLQHRQRHARQLRLVPNVRDENKLSSRRPQRRRCSTTGWTLPTAPPSPDRGQRRRHERN